MQKKKQFSPEERKQILETVFLDHCETIGPKNLKKICQDESVAVIKTKYGSNMMFGDIITVLIHAVDFINNALSIYTTLSDKEKQQPQVIVKNTINIINLGDQLSEETQLELAKIVTNYAEGNDE